MYDTVHIVLPAPDLGRVVAGLERAEERVRHDTGAVRYSGFVGPVWVGASARRLKLRGSLARALRHAGWRPGVPTRGDVRAARSLLEDCLGVSLASARVWRVDVFSDLALAAAPASYLGGLVRKPRFQRSGYDGTSRHFSADHRELAFYDKDAQQGVPNADRRRLRYELRLTKRVAEQTGRKLTFADLHDQALWALLADRWQSEYGTIEKRRGLCAPSGPFRWQDHVAATAAHTVGTDDYIDLLKVEWKAGRLSRSQYHTARKNVLRAVSNPVLTAADGYIEELDAAVADAAGRMREAGR